MKKSGGEENAESREMQNRQSRTATDEPTRSWCDESWEPVDKDRIEGMQAFVDYITDPEHSTERAKCQDRAHARRMFAKHGGFYLEEDAPAEEKYRGIPRTTVFRVYEPREKRGERDEEVVLVLPGLAPDGSENESYDEEAFPVWRCTYIPYRGDRTTKR